MDETDLTNCDSLPAPADATHVTVHTGCNKYLAFNVMAQMFKGKYKGNKVTLNAAESDVKAYKMETGLILTD